MKAYGVKEERINVVSHAIGIALASIGLILLLIKGFNHEDPTHIISYIIFALSMILLYTASTLYHNEKNEQKRKRLKILDHTSIYVLIAGTYTPFALIALKGVVGWLIFGIAWGIALAGIILKLFFTGRFKIASTIMYVGMGWIVIFAIEPMKECLSYEALFWLFAGGASYTIGAVLYSIKKIPYNHATFHILVLGGTLCHFIAIYFYI